MFKGFLSTLAIMALLSNSTAANEKIKIGFITTFTTGAGMIGQDMRDAVNLALDHMNNKMAGLEVEVIFEDDALKPEIGKQKTEKLVLKDKVNFVSGYIWSHVLLASYKTVVDNDIFLVGSNAGPSQLAGKLCHENFFSTSWQNDQTPMAMGEVLNQRGIKSLYVMVPNYAAGKNMAAGVERTYRGLVVKKELTKFPGQLDFSAELAKVRSTKPDALFVFYPGKHGTQFFKQYQQSGLQGKIPLYSVFTVDAINLKLLKDQAIGSLMTQFWAPDLEFPANKKFVSGFKVKYGRYPSFYAAQAYDSIRLIQSAVKAVDGNLDDRVGIRSSMRKANFPSVRGPYKYGNNHFPIQNFYLTQIVTDSSGIETPTIVSKVFQEHQDTYAKQCEMIW